MFSGGQLHFEKGRWLCIYISSSPKNENPVFIYSPKCHFKPIWFSFFCITQKKIIYQVFCLMVLVMAVHYNSLLCVIKHPREPARKYMWLANHFQRTVNVFVTNNLLFMSFHHKIVSVTMTDHKVKLNAARI